MNCSKLTKLTSTLLAFALAHTLGCASKPDVAAPTLDGEAQQRAAEEFEKGNVLMDSEDYAGALKVYNSILLDYPVTTLDSLITFNAGLSHLMLKQCQAAEDMFRKVVRFSSKKTPQLALRAKLKLSDSLACLGKSKESMVLLIEIFKDQKRLPVEVGEAEIPAKIAAGYARIGNRKMADRYFAIAELGLRKIEAQNLPSKDRRALLARTLFLMGDTSFLVGNNMPAAAYFNTLKTQQRYLLRSIEYDVKPWAMKAYDQIMAAYDRTWSFVDEVSAPPEMDETRQRRYLKEQKAKIVQTALLSIKDLRQQRNLGQGVSGLLSELFRSLGQQENKMSNFLVAEVPGSEYTTEAMKLQAPKREGRVKSDETVLEKRAKKKQ